MTFRLWIIMLLISIPLSFVCYGEELENRETWTYVSTSTPYELEGMQSPPETAILTFQDDITGGEYDREVPLKKVTEKEAVWTEGFSFPITISGYDADVFLLGETEIPANADLAVYGKELLEAADLPNDYYRVESVEWIGDSYEVDGILYRDAMAKGLKLIRKVDVLYGGQIRVPDMESNEKNPETECEELSEEEIPSSIAISKIGIEESDLQADSEEIGGLEESLYDKFMNWVKEHLTVVLISIGAFMVLSGVLLLGKYTWKKSRD